MSTADVSGLLIGIATLAAAAAYLVQVYRRPEHFQWLELPRNIRHSPRHGLL
ncbi:MAG: hypothetical protein K2X44_10395 [Magnetospirillum sp.]|nr:hypothetical protein [Magnetospirillum sp.]